MGNITYHGKKYLTLYLMDYYLGNISFKEVTLYLDCCFSAVKTGEII